jgi:hypothetical protein
MESEVSSIFVYICYEIVIIIIMPAKYAGGTQISESWYHACTLHISVHLNLNCILKEILHKLDNNIFKMEILPSVIQNLMGKLHCNTFNTKNVAQK